MLYYNYTTDELCCSKCDFKASNDPKINACQVCGEPFTANEETIPNDEPCSFCNKHNCECDIEHDRAMHLELYNLIEEDDDGWD